VKKIYWIRASKPPTELTLVLMVGGNYCVTQGIWWGGNATKKAGFYIQAGENLFHAPWVEWWIPTPEKPQNSVYPDVNNERNTDS
jgi:hypothetical protein